MPNSGVGVSVIQIRKFLKGQGWAVFATICHRVMPKAHNPLSTELDIDEYFSGGVMSEQSGHHYSCHDDLIWVYGLFRKNASNDWQWATLHEFPPPQGLCNLYKTGQRYRGLWSDVDWCSINFWDGVVGASAFAVAYMAVAVGQPLLWVIDRDPLGWVLLPHAQLLGDSWGWPSSTMVRLFLSI